MRFHIGQRVKKTRGALNVGVTGVVVEVGLRVIGPSGKLNDMRVRADSAWTGASSGLPKRAGVPGFARSGDWEPILPEGAAPSTWDACLWRPDGSHKRVAEEGRAIALRVLL